MTCLNKSTEMTNVTPAEVDVGSATVATATAAKPGCCGGPAKADATACCVADEAAKASGKSGCGCGARPAVEGKSSPCGG